MPQSEYLPRTTVQWKSLGKKLHNQLYSEKGFAVLNQTPAEGGTWTAGGCYMLTNALADLIHGEKKCIVESHAPQKCQHTVLQVSPNGFLDGDGFTRQDQLLQRWATEEMLTNPRIVPLADISKINFTSPAAEKYVQDFLQPLFRRI